MLIGIAHPTNKVNFSLVQLGNFRLWFSYNTIIVIDHPLTGKIVIENIYSRTTGKHLSYVKRDKTARLDALTFMLVKDEILKGIG